MKRIALATIPILGAVISRAHGAGWLPKVVLSILWALPFAPLPYTEFEDKAFAVSLVVIVIGLCALGKSMAHGQWFSLGTVWKYIKPERLDFLLVPFFGDDPRSAQGMQGVEVYREIKYNKLYWRCVTGMALKGFASVSGAVIAFGFINPLFSVIVALGGISCALAYMIGWAVYPKHATVIGEVLSGGFAYLSLSIVWGLL